MQLISVPSSGARPLQFDDDVRVSSCFDVFQSPQAGQGLCNAGIQLMIAGYTNVFQSPQAGQGLCNMYMKDWSRHSDRAFQSPQAGQGLCNLPYTVELLCLVMNFSPLNRGKASAMSTMCTASTSNRKFQSPQAGQGLCNTVRSVIKPGTDTYISVPSSGARPLQYDSFAVMQCKLN